MSAIQLMNPMIFTESLGNAMEKLKILKDEEKFCDIVLFVDKTKFFLHRNILASFSPYFERILYSHKTVVETFNVTCQSPEIFQYLVNYMYTGSVTIHAQNVQELLKLAHRLEVSRLKMYCAEYLERYLDVSNCLQVWQMTNKCCMPNLTNHVVTFMNNQINTVLTSKELLNLDLLDFEEVIGLKDLVLTSIQTFRTIVDWVKNDIPAREKHIKQLLRLIDWRGVNIETIQAILEKDPLFSTSELVLYICLKHLSERSLAPIQFQGLLDSLHQKYDMLSFQEVKQRPVESIAKRSLEKRHRKKKRLVRGNPIARLAALRLALIGRKKKKRKIYVEKLDDATKLPDMETNERNLETLKCHLCDDHFSTDTTTLEHHLSSVHSRDVTYKCGVCGYVCQWNNLYLEHIQGHFPGPPYKCDSCNYVCSKLNEVMTHRSIHAEEKTFKCMHCSFRSRSQSTVAIHSKSHGPAERAGEGKNYVCDHCGYSTKYLSHLIAHKRIHSTDVYRCTYPQCKFTTGTKSQLGSHARSHQSVRPHCCQICGRGFLEKSHLVRHERIHLEEKPFKCHECDYASSRRDKLKEHQARHHGDHASAKVPYKARPNKKPQLYQESFSPGESNGGRSGHSSNMQDVISQHHSSVAVNYSAFPSDPHTHHSTPTVSTLDFHQQQLLTSTSRTKEHRAVQQSTAAAAVTAAMMLDPRFHHSVPSGGSYVPPVGGIVGQPPGQVGQSSHQVPEYPTALMSLF